MKRKIIFAFICFIVFVICFTASVSLYDYFYEQKLRKNIHVVKIGMPEKDVIQILGEPTNKQMSDISGLYWEYSTNSFDWVFYQAGERPAYMLLEMSSDGKVVKVFDFRD